MNILAHQSSHQQTKFDHKLELVSDNTKPALTSTLLVSVIIPVYNSSKYIQKAIDSVLAQTYSNYEIIVVDDGSTDNTKAKLEQYKDKIRYVYQENQGSAAARNTGIKLAQGELIAFLDADDLWSMSQKLEKQVACFVSDPDLGGVNTGWRIIDESGKHIKTVQPWHKAPKLDLETWLKKKCVRTSAMIFRREWLEKVGGFDPEIRQSHDVDLILRLSLAGCKTIWLKEETVCYRQHGENTTKDSLKQAIYVQAVLDKFFSHHDLPKSISIQESRVRYHTLVWIAWCQYRANNLDDMTRFLQKSLSFSPYLKVENISHWLTSFKRFFTERGENFDVRVLTDSLQWQELTVLTLGLKNAVKLEYRDKKKEKCDRAQKYRQTAQHLQSQSKFNEALENYRQAQELDSTLEVQQEISLLLRSKIESEISLDTKVEEYKKLGAIWSKQERFAETVVLYRLAVERKPKSHKLYKSLGDALKQQNQLDEAIKAYQKSIKLNTKFPWSYKGLGDVFDLKGQYTEAIDNYQKAIAIKSKIIFLVGERLEALLDEQERWDESVELYRYGLEKHPDNQRFEVKIQEKLGDSYIAKENWDLAFKSFVRALHLKPDYFTAYEKIASIFELQGKPIVPLAGATTPSTYCNLPQDFLQHYCQLTQDYVVDSKSNFLINHIPVFPNNVTQFRASKSLEKRVVPDCLQARTVEVAEAFVAVVPNGRCWGDKVTSAVIDADNKLIANTYTGAAELIISSSELAEPQQVDGTVAFLSVRWGTVGYFHWIFDILTRMELLRLSGIDFASIDKFIINRCSKKFQMETLALMGIPKNKIIESNNTHHIRAKTVIVPSEPQLRAYRDARWACDALKKRFIKSSDLNTFGKLDYIYINRLNAPHRRVVNESKVISFLESWGFTNIALESMSFSEQVLCMASAKVIVAVHGAGLSNLAFCNPGTKVIEIFSPAHIQNTYWRISNVSDIEHYHLMSDDTHSDIDLSERSVKRDVCVNIAELTKLFEIAKIKPLPSYQQKHLLRMQQKTDTCVLYRILGNDLPPRHKQGQVLENLRFILDREAPLSNCQKRWVVNRIVNPQQEQAIIQLLEERGQTYIHIPFVEWEYAQVDFNYQGFPDRDYLNSKEFQELTPSQQKRAIDHLYHNKNIYTMNNNGSRNLALKEGKTIAKWVLPWDGNCFLTQTAWQEIVDGIKRYGSNKYLIVPMARILDNQQLLDPNFVPEANEEPQIIFRQDAMEEFNERTVRYGHFSKLELLKRLSVPGRWDKWGYDPWDIKGRQTSCESGQFEQIGWVARLFSGEKKQEQDATQRQFGRLEAIKGFLDNLDKKIIKQ